MKSFFVCLALLFSVLHSFADENTGLLIIKSKEITSAASIGCDSFLCLARRIQGTNPMDPQKFTAKLAPNIQLQCTITKTILAGNILRSVCEVALDTSKVIDGVLTSVNDFFGVSILTVEITKKDILDTLSSKMQGLPWIGNHDKVLVPGANGQAEELERMELGCIYQAGSKSISSCTLTGVLN